MPPTTSQLTTSRGIVEYVDVGQGIPILYFHGTGAGCDAAVLLEQPLLESGCRLIVPNRPGYYGTALSQRGAVEPCVVQAVELLDHLAIRQAVVIGCSGGGMPAVRFAATYPQRAASLILQCCQTHQWDSAKWLPVSLKATLLLFRYSIFRPLLSWETRRRASAACQSPVTYLKQMSGSRFPEIAGDDDVLRQITRLAEMSLACASQLDGVQNDWAVLVGDNGLQKGMIKCKTMIIHDRVDPLVPFAHAEWSRDCIPDAELLDVHVGGHFIWAGKDFVSMHQRKIDFLRNSLDNY